MIQHYWAQIIHKSWLSRRKERYRTASLGTDHAKVLVEQERGKVSYSIIGHRPCISLGRAGERKGIVQHHWAQAIHKSW